MKKLILLFILSFFSAQGIAASCPDGSDPVKSVSADGSYYEYKCANDNEQTSSTENDIDNNEIIGRCKHGSVLPKITKFNIKMSHEKSIPKDGCLIVKENTNNPAKSNQRSVKITVHPEFCSWDDGWNDCENDRSRVEFYDGEGVGSRKGVVYNFSIYIPKEVDISQNDHSKKNHRNAVFLSQLNTTTENHYSSLVMLTWTDSYGLIFQTYDDFNWNISKKIKIPNSTPDSQRDRWINISYEVDVYPNNKGKLIIYADNKMIYERYNHPTIINGGFIKLKLGIYNYLVSQMKGPRTSQYVYYDDIVKKVISF
jgi:hypothetical protein